MPHTKVCRPVGKDMYVCVGYMYKQITDSVPCFRHNSPDVNIHMTVLELTCSPFSFPAWLGLFTDTVSSFHPFTVHFPHMASPITFHRDKPVGEM